MQVRCWYNDVLTAVELLASLIAGPTIIGSTPHCHRVSGIVCQQHVFCLVQELEMRGVATLVGVVLKSWLPETFFHILARVIGVVVFATDDVVRFDEPQQTNSFV